MLLKHFILYFILNVFFCVHGLKAVDILKPSNHLKIIKNVAKLTDTLLEVTPYINITISPAPPNCIQMLCKFVCFHGKSSEIDKDIDIVSQINNLTCSTVDELRLYNYEFPGNKIFYGFLGSYSAKVANLYVASANVTDIATGSFANGIFQKIHFENLKLKELNKDFFKGVSTAFQGLSIIQKEKPLTVVNADFLYYVKYQIKYLTLQVGLGCVRNLTDGDYLLNNLKYVDFAYNNFQGQFTDTTFSKLSMVEHMDLSHSNLEYLPPYIFADFTGTLELLDLSFNRLTTITRTIFGWHDLPRELKIYANDNEWLCSCELQTELKEIFIYQTTQVVCSGPDDYLKWSAFDDRICENDDDSIMDAETTLSLESTTAIISDDPEEQFKPYPPGFDVDPPIITDDSTESVRTTSIHYFVKPNSTEKGDFISLDCLDGPNRQEHTIQSLIWPLLEFDVKILDHLRVSVIIESTSNLNDSFGLIWFSKVTTEYYKMEINYNEYGLGCYGAISYVTIVDELIPNMAYTFCVILKSHLKTSPFSCKSIHVGSNLSIQYSAWLTKDMRVTGLSLIIFGVVMFSFAGILMIYLLLKHKPILLKGSKRVSTTHVNNGDIVVLPKERSVQSIKDKEKKLASSGTFSCSQGRRNSSDSVASYQSYINANLYEIIPAYTKIKPSPSISSSNPHVQLNSTEVEYSDMECCYLTPLHTVSSSADLVNYAEIPYRAKRVSNDPLPEVPADQAPMALALSENVSRAENSDVGVIYMLDSQV